MFFRRRQRTQAQNICREYLTRATRSPSQPSGPGTLGSTGSLHETYTPPSVIAQTMQRERGAFGRPASPYPHPHSSYWNHPIFDLGRSSYTQSSRSNQISVQSFGITTLPAGQARQSSFDTISQQTIGPHSSLEATHGIYHIRSSETGRTL